MKFNVDFYYTQVYLPTKRHRKERHRVVEDVVEVDVAELEEKDFPVAFIVHDYASVYDNAQCYEDFDGNGDFRMFSEEIRYHNGKFFKVMRISYGSAVSSNHYEPLSKVAKLLRPRLPYFNKDKDFTEQAVVIYDTRQGSMEEVMVKAQDYVIYDGKLWKVCGEPMYKVQTYGLGNNHGGTGFHIQYSFAPAQCEYAFSALEREEAIAHGKETALNRGDTNYVEGMGEHDIIEVLMPELVTKIPRKKAEELKRSPIYHKLKPHIGHKIVCVAYGDVENPHDICIECEDCCETLISSEDFEEEDEVAVHKYVVATFDTENKVRTAFFDGSSIDEVLARKDVVDFIDGKEYSIEECE